MTKYSMEFALESKYNLVNFWRFHEKLPILMDLPGCVPDAVTEKAPKQVDIPQLDVSAVRTSLCVETSIVSPTTDSEGKKHLNQ